MTRYQGWEKDGQEIAEHDIERLIECGAYFLTFVLLALAAVLSY